MRPVGRWLLAMWAMVWVMVGIGGITRLTGSGLSMVEWHPLMGALPPLTEAEWLEVFGRYKQSPQYLTVNHWMGLSDFKRIFFWEYVHRLFGRLIGLAFFAPFAYFVFRRRLRGGGLWKAVLAFALGGGQGLLGWYMVQSGLVDQPRVSHFRLAAHLGLAFAVGEWLLWMALDVLLARETRAAPGRIVAGWLLCAGVALQVIGGAFMAGTGAGRLASTFPDMNGGFSPGPFFRFDGLVENLLHNPLAIHWTHRAFAWVLLGLGTVLAASSARHASSGSLRVTSFLLGGALSLQFALGAVTAMWHVAVPLAVAHQLCGYLLWSATIVYCHRLAGRGSNTAAG